MKAGSDSRQQRQKTAINTVFTLKQSYRLCSKSQIAHIPLGLVQIKVNITRQLYLLYSQSPRAVCYCV